MKLKWSMNRNQRVAFDNMKEAMKRIFGGDN